MACCTLLLVHSANAAVSDEVENEISWALDCHIAICVVNIDDSPFRKEYNMSLKKGQNIWLGSENYKEELLRSLPEKARQI